MKSFAIKTSFRLLAVLFLASIVLGGCAGMQLRDEAASVPAGYLRVIVTNDTDIFMYHNTRWLNHNIPKVRGPATVCVAELQPGKNQTFDRNMSSWNFTGTRIYTTYWYPCRDYNNELKKYESRVVSEIPEGTAIIKIYHKHFEVVPR